MKRKLVLSLATLVLGSLFLLGLKSANSVLAHRALESGDCLRALAIIPYG